MNIIFLTLFSLGLIAGALGQVQKPCPDNWSLQGTKCYWFSGDVQRNWPNAQQYCQDIGGDLGGTYTVSDLNFVTNLTSNPLYSTWSGLNQNGASWSFIDKTYTTYLSSLWLSGEPKANQGTCGAIRSVSPGGYFNLPCSNVQPFLCAQKYATCDSRNLTTRAGQVQSPNFPQTYANNENCIQYIIGNATNFIELTFDAWNVEPRYDYVMLYDGLFPGGPFQVIANLSYDPTNVTDGNPKATFQTVSNIMTIRFVTDASVVRTGWHANYTQKPYLLPNYQSGSSGVITSPNYPSNYPNDAEQFTYINTLEGTQIILQFTDFRTEANRDILFVYDGVDQQAPLLGNFSGANLPTYVQSTNNSMTLFFLTDYSLVYKGFSAFWGLV